MHDHSGNYENAVKLLKARDYKLTTARKVVLEVLYHESQHLTSAEILERVKSKAPTVGRASIFRSLELFTELGIIRPANYDAQITRYVVMEADGHHAHLVCSECQQVIDLGDCRLEPVLNDYAREHHFEVSGHLLELYGICQDCTALKSHNQPS